MKTIKGDGRRMQKTPGERAFEALSRIQLMTWDPALVVIRRAIEAAVRADRRRR